MSRQIRIIETGETFRSVHDVARVLGVTPGAVTHQLKGRQKRVKGCTLEYLTVPDRKHLYRKMVLRKIIYDDTGRWYHGYVEVARVHGITADRARYLVMRDAEGIFRTKKESNDLFGPINV